MELLLMISIGLKAKLVIDRRCKFIVRSGKEIFAAVTRSLSRSSLNMIFIYTSGVSLYILATTVPLFHAVPT